jgi:hypothetical protein
MTGESCEMIVVPASESNTGRDELYIAFNGKLIARRGYPGSPQARTWVSMEPDFEVTMEGGDLVIVQDGERVAHALSHGSILDRRG